MQPATSQNPVSVHAPSLPELSDAFLLDLYSCASTPARWAPVLDQLCIATGARSAFVQALRVQGSGMHQYWSAQDTHSANFIMPYVGRLADGANPRLDVRCRQHGVGRFVSDGDLFGRETLALRDFRERLAAFGMGRFIGTLWKVDADNYIALALHRNINDNSGFSTEQIAWLHALSAHIFQAANLAQKLAAANDFNEHLRRHFDHLRCGMVICSQDGSVVWANRRAEQLLVDDSALRLHAGSLLGRSTAVTKALLQEISTVLATGKSSHLAVGPAPHVLHLALHRQERLNDPYRNDSSVLLILTRPDMICAMAPQAIARLFGLTPAESRLTGALVEGFTLDQYALQQRVSLGTVRGQLKQVLHKTGAARQSELVRLLLSSCAAQVTGY